MPYVPGGANTKMWVITGGVWTRMSRQPYLDSSGTWLPVKATYRAVHTAVNPSTLLLETTWAAQTDWRSPAGISVPGIVFSKVPSSIATYAVQVSWTVITDPADLRYNCSVSVLFTNTTAATSDTQVMDQSLGSARSPTWALGDRVNAQVSYVNDNGNGTVTTTATITLGP